MKLLKRTKDAFWEKARQLIISNNWDNTAARVGLFTPRIIVRMDGGLASQMLFFSVGYVAAKKANLPLYLDVTWFQKYGQDLNGVNNRGFNLFNAFPAIKENYEDKTITQKDIPSLFLRLFKDSSNTRDFTEYDPALYTGHSLYLNYYYANVLYFADEQEELSRLFRFGESMTEHEQVLLQEINTCTSCALHIRRGDYCGTIHDVCTENYYKKAIACMQERHPDVVFYVFTNDEGWTEKFLNQSCSGIKYIMLKDRSEATPISDMHLMAACKHAIISNSGFSFFPAFLTYSKDKDVMMPEIWINGKQKDLSRDIFYMPGWIKLSID